MAIILFETLASSTMPIISYQTKKIVDILSLPQNQNFDAVRHPFWLLIIVMLGSVLFNRASGNTNIYTMPRIRVEIKRDLFAYVRKHSYEYFLNNFAGSIAHRINEVSTNISIIFSTVLFLYTPVIMGLVFSLYFLMQVHMMLGVVFLGWIFIYIFVSLSIAKHCQELSRKAAESRSRTGGTIVDTVSNIASVRAFARGRFEEEYLANRLIQEREDTHKLFRFMDKNRWFQGLSKLVLFGFMIYLSLDYLFKGELSLGSFVLVFTLIRMSMTDLTNMTQRFLEVFENLGSIKDGLSVLNVPHDIQDLATAKAIPITKGEIVFDHVDFSYRNGHQIFEDLNLTIPAGQKVGLVGFSGSGKSTFMNLILRHFDLKQGSIKLDGHDIRELTQDSLRSQIAFVPQDPQMFHRSLMENIRYGQLEAPDEQVFEAARKAYAHEFIETLPEQYRSIAGERGIKLSGGQRQRIAIARAFLKDAPILLMDEATSSLDSASERKIQSTLEEIMKNRTVIVIAHRLSTISHLDRILVFDQGRIIEDGSHTELLKKKNGHYAKLWNMQAGGFLPE